jgi:hypothetical protein
VKGTSRPIAEIEYLAVCPNQRIASKYFDARFRGFGGGQTPGRAGDLLWEKKLRQFSWHLKINGFFGVFDYSVQLFSVHEGGLNRNQQLCFIVPDDGGHARRQTDEG